MFLRYHVLLLVFAKALFFEAKFSQVPETHEEILPLFTDAPLFSPTVGRCFAYVDKVRSVDVPCYKYRNILGNYLFSVDMQSHDGDSSQVNIPEWYMHIRARNKQAKHRASHKARKDDERINLLIEKQRVVELERAAAGKDVASQARRNASERRKERLATESLARFRTVSTAAVFSTAVQACARGGKASSGRAHSGSTSHGGATVGGGGATRGLGVAAAAKAAARKLQKAETQNMDTKVLQMLNELEEDEQQHLQWQPIDPKPLAAKTQEISMWIKPGVFLTKTIINA